MGQLNLGMYRDGDIPRDTISVFDCGGSGYSYYLSSIEGKCSKCSEKTKWWNVNIKSKGKHLCQSCHLNDQLHHDIDVNSVSQSSSS